MREEKHKEERREAVGREDQNLRKRIQEVGKK